MKWLFSCCCWLLSIVGVHAALPDNVDEIDIQIEYLEQQKILLKKRYQGDVVYQHRRLTQVSPTGTPKDQAQAVQSNTAQHFSWLVQAQAQIDQEILNLKRHRKKVLLKSDAIPTQPRQKAQSTAHFSGQSLSIPVPQAATPSAIPAVTAYTVRLVVPKARVVWQQGQAFVNVLTEQGLEVKAIEIGSDVGQGWIQVLSGLSVGDVIQ